MYAPNIVQRSLLEKNIKNTAIVDIIPYTNSSKKGRRGNKSNKIGIYKMKSN